MLLKKKKLKTVNREIVTRRAISCNYLEWGVLLDETFQRSFTDLCHLPKKLLEIIKGNLPEGLYAVVALAPG